jgi:hypothetical protein
LTAKISEINLGTDNKSKLCRERKVNKDEELMPEEETISKLNLS